MYYYINLIYKWLQSSAKENFTFPRTIDNQLNISVQ